MNHARNLLDFSLTNLFSQIGVDLAEENTQNQLVNPTGHAQSLLTLNKEYSKQNMLGHAGLERNLLDICS